MMLLGAMKKLKCIFNNFSKTCSTKRLILHIMVNCHPLFENGHYNELGCNSSMLWNKDLSLVLKKTLSRLLLK